MSNQEANIIYLWAHQRHIHGLGRYRHQGYHSLLPNHHTQHQNQKPKQCDNGVIVPFRKKS